jgi:branched-chain amino acid transport system permease protein
VLLATLWVHGVQTRVGAVTTAWSGLALGAIYALVALGYNVVFVSSGTFNFANAQLVVLGTFVAYWGLVQLKLPVAAVFLLAAAVVGLVAVVEERLAVRPARTPEAQLVTTVGVATLLEGIASVIWGGQPLEVPFFGSTHVLKVLGGRVFPVDLWLVGAAVVCTVLLALLSRSTLLGLVVLAVAEDHEAAAARGVPVRAVVVGAFAVSGVLAGLVGPLVGPQTFAVASLGTSFALYGFVALAMGGFGSLVGGLVGGFVVGLVQAFGARYVGAQYGDVLVFGVLLTLLFIRPGGMLGTTRERTV